MLDRAATLAGVEEILSAHSDPERVLDALTELLYQPMAGYSWVGIYLPVGEELVLGPWRGPLATEHTRIPIGQGICGLAARTAETVIVADVRQNASYLACFVNTRAEIVVPILHDGEVVGEIDVDGDQVGAFGPADQELLEAVAARVAPATAALARRLAAA